MYMKTTLIRVFLVVIFAGTSLLILYSTAEPKAAGTISRFYWPVTIGAIVAGGIVYWGGLKALQIRWGAEDTLGRRIGFEVSVHEVGEEIPSELAALMTEAIADGSRRRLTYKVSQTPL